MKQYNCPQCKKDFKDYPANRKGKVICCSRKCKGLYQSKRYLGVNNPCWRGGKPACIKCGKQCYNRDARWCGTCSQTEAKHNWKGGISFTRERHAYYDHRAKMNRRDVEGSHTQAEWEQLKKTYQFMCLCCKRTDVKLTEDHIIPIIVGGTDYIWNIQPLCQSCNAIKHTKIIDYRERLVS